jgi:predicted dehydrogenase
VSRIRIGVIGCGHWGPNHVRVFSQLRDSVVTAVADSDPKRLGAIADQYPDVECFADYTQVLAKPTVDAVVVCVPTRKHFAIVRDAIEAGKHVLCEKPLCHAVSEAETLDALAASRSVCLMTGHVFLFNPGILKLKDLIASGSPGSRIYHLRALRTNLGPIRQDVDSVYDLASHDIAIFNFLLEAEPLSVSAVGASFLQEGIADLAFITLKYPNDVLANVHVSWLDPKKLREIVVVGDQKMIVWDDLSPAGAIQIYDKGVIREPFYEGFGEFRLLAREGDVTIPRVAPEEPLKNQNRRFLESIRAGAVTVSDGRFATGVVRVLEAKTASMKAGGQPVSVARP